MGRSQMLKYIFAAVLSLAACAATPQSAPEELNEPTPPHALQVPASLLIGSKRVEDAEPYLEKLLASDGVNLENGFMQLSRLLAGNPDKSANLRVVRQLAAKHPKLAPAQFAIAQA